MKVSTVGPLAGSATWQANVLQKHTGDDRAHACGFGTQSAHSIFRPPRYLQGRELQCGNVSYLSSQRAVGSSCNTDQ